MIKVKDVHDPDKFKELHIESLGALRDGIDHMIRTCELNKKDPYKVPVIVRDSSSRDDYIFFTTSLGIGKYWTLSLEFYGNDKDRIDYYEGEDKQPEGGGEFWKSRGPSSWDCSGFIVSKEAGERLLEMVHKVLNKQETETWLDWRKYEPNWIQFKFSAKEFDVKKLDEMAKDGIITEEILKECKL